MTVISHHPVIIHLESILIGFLAVNINLSIFHRQFITLVNMNRTLINRKILYREFHRLSLFGNPYRSVVIRSPVLIHIQRVQAPRIISRCILNTDYNILTRQQTRFRFFRQRHIINRSIRIIHHHILLADTQFMSQVIGNRTLGFHQITILHIIRLFISFTIQINNTILYLQRLSGQTHTPLHVVLTAVYRTADYLTEVLWILFQVLPSQLIIIIIDHPLLLRSHGSQIHRFCQLLACAITQTVNIIIGHTGGNCISGRKVKDNDIIQLYIPQTFHPFIIPLWMLKV